MQPKVFIVDDHLAILQTLAYTLPRVAACEIVGTSCSSSEALKRIPDAKPDVLWVDVCMPELDGPGLLRLLRERLVPARTVLFTGAANGAQIREAMQSAPACFVSKTDDLDCWRKAITAAATGGSYFSSGIERMRHRLADPDLAKLSDTERTVFSLVVRNVAKERIAEILGISTHTVRHHRERLMGKLGAHSIGELCVIAARAGLLESPPE